MSALAFGVLAGLLAVTIEALMKRDGFEWVPSLWWVAPAALTLNYFVYRIVQGSPSLPAAFIIFSAATMTARVALSIWSRHPIGAGTWIALMLALAALGFRAWKP